MKCWNEKDEGSESQSDSSVGMEMESKQKH